MLRQLIQKIKAMLLCIEYGILFVDTVNTKIKACNAWLNIKEVMTQNVLTMSTLSIHLKSPDSELSKTLNRLKIG